MAEFNTYSRYIAIILMGMLSQIKAGKFDNTASFPQVIIVNTEQ